MLSQATRRSTLRWIHIAVSIPVCGYVYTPFKDLPSFAPSIRSFFLPALALSGLWLWKGHVVRRLLSGTSQSFQRRRDLITQGAASNN
jgi:hypothetical protein